MITAIENFRIENVLLVTCSPFMGRLLSVNFPPKETRFETFVLNGQVFKMWNYVVTAQKPTAVNLSVVCNFTSETGSPNLIIR
jgi:hypothetical protein